MLIPVFIYLDPLYSNGKQRTHRTTAVGSMNGKEARMDFKGEVTIKASARKGLGVSNRSASGDTVRAWTAKR